MPHDFAHAFLPVSHVPVDPEVAELLFSLMRFVEGVFILKGPFHPSDVFIAPLWCADASSDASSDNCFEDYRLVFEPRGSGVTVELYAEEAVTGDPVLCMWTSVRHESNVNHMAVFEQLVKYGLRTKEQP